MRGAMPPLDGFRIADINATAAHDVMLANECMPIGSRRISMPCQTTGACDRESLIVLPEGLLSASPPASCNRVTRSDATVGYPYKQCSVQW
jgi:hypothetical protein